MVEEKAYEKPDYVKKWEASPGTPRTCFLCQFFENPRCKKFNGEVVPLDFAVETEVCEYWVDKDGIPF